MAISESGQSTEPPYHSYKELRGDGIHASFTPAARRLFWPLDGAFPTAISVMKTPGSPEDLEPYFQPDVAGDSSGTWHEVSKLSLTEPKVSSIEASVYDLEQWEFNWMAWHELHTEGDFVDQEYVTYGDLSDEDRPYAKEQKEDLSWEEDSDTDFLVHCCGQDRPLRKRGITLVVTPAASHEFVTVHDYVCAVHPWLMSLREDILKAKTISRAGPYPASASKEWMVCQGAWGPDIHVEEKESWLRKHGDGSGSGLPRPVPGSTAAILARIRDSRKS
ncbi:hypothetical protein PVAG01_03307 [Phlyctema vagabunda]|uniref:Uncharacterized protein n=1 Tax=Phlyctema vagabunda TaxID=108571 RepID=A0ABR4PM77_9HELO